MPPFSMVNRTATRFFFIYTQPPPHCQYSTAAPENVQQQVPVNVPEPTLSSKNTAQFKKGTGGRASFSGNVITGLSYIHKPYTQLDAGQDALNVFGASGFTGLSVVNRLAKQGNQLIIPYRSDPYFIKEHKVSGELGQILFFPFELKDENSIQRAVKYSNVVVNLIGSFIDTPNYSIASTNVKGCQRIARICREMGVERLVHVSALGADSNHVSSYKKNGQFLKTKGLGELAVRDEFPQATIVRPSVMYGERDFFIYMMMSALRRMPALGWVYVYKGGHGIYKMPTFMNDFSLGIARIAMDPGMAGKIFEFVGPHCYEMCELVDYMYRKAGCHPDISTFYRRNSFPDPWFYLWSGLCSLSRRVYRSNRGYINWEWLDFVEGNSDVLTGGDTLGFKDLGIKPQEFENVGGKWCFIWSFSRSLELQYGEYIEPPLPLRSPPLYKTKPRSERDVVKIHMERDFGLG